jgi:hypothetical protein
MSRRDLRPSARCPRPPTASRSSSNRYSIEILEPPVVMTRDRTWARSPVTCSPRNTVPEADSLSKVAHDPAGHFVEGEEVVSDPADPGALVLAAGNSRRRGLGDREHARDRGPHDVERPQSAGGRPRVVSLLGSVCERKCARPSGSHQGAEPSAASPGSRRPDDQHYRPGVVRVSR